jgi:DNA-directed RNA polymerase specialized sigma24 family protein
LALIKTEGMTPEEIAAILDVETDYVEKLKVSADEAVKKQIGGEVLSMVARIDALKRKK